MTDVAEVTGHPEMMDGRVKTLHPAVHAGILARRDRDDDLAALEEHGYGPIDLVAVNLYPFRETVAKGGVAVEEAMEKVDIGGPTMIRAAAKNHTDVWVVVDPADYAGVLSALDGGGDEASALRRTLAAKVFRHISTYDAAIAAYLEEGTGASDALPGGSPAWPTAGADPPVRREPGPGSVLLRLRRARRACRLSSSTTARSSPTTTSWIWTGRSCALSPFAFSAQPGRLHRQAHDALLGWPSGTRWPRPTRRRWRPIR